MKLLVLLLLPVIFLLDVRSTLAQDIILENAYPELSFNSPIDFQLAPGIPDSVFIVERAGAIQRIWNDRQAAGKEEVFDIRSRVSTQGEGGLLGAAFHPEFDQNGYLFVYYTASNPFRSVIARFETDPEHPRIIDPDSETILLEIDQPRTNHNGGQIRFGPDGYLYIALGDGGGGGDPFENGQDRTTLHGNILRIDVDQADDGLNYAIPADNPFAGNEDGWHEEIYAWGFRNPFRFSFDAETGKLWVADVGQNDREEVNVVEAGKNYGWNIMEGSICYPPSSECDTTGLELPVYEYGFSGSQSITGGFVYRGSTAPELHGRYFYGDFTSGDLWSFDFDGEEAFDNRSIGEVGGFQLVCFGEDHDGELYVCLMSQGQVYRLNMEDVPTSGEPVAEIPGVVRLDQNYPNPFNPATVIRFQLPEAADVTLEVFDMLGQRIALPADGRMAAGEHEAVWDATGMASGLYLYRLTTNDVSLTRRMMLVK